MTSFFEVIQKINNRGFVEVLSNLKFPGFLRMGFAFQEKHKNYQNDFLALKYNSRIVQNAGGLNSKVLND